MSGGPTRTLTRDLPVELPDPRNPLDAAARCFGTFRCILRSLLGQWIHVHASVHGAFTEFHRFST